MNTFFLPEDTNGCAAWLRNFAARLCLYAGKYAIGRDVLLDVQAGSMIFHYWLDYKNKYDAYLCKCRSCPGIAEGDRFLQTLPAPECLWPPQAALPDVFALAAELVRHIRNHASFTEADGIDMGIGGKEDMRKNGTDMALPVACP